MCVGGGAGRTIVDNWLGMLNLTPKSHLRLSLATSASLKTLMIPFHCR